MSVDGTYCSIRNSRPFSSVWYSHKLNGPVLRYDLEVGTKLGLIVCVNGNFAAGHYSDVNIFREDLKEKWAEDKFVIADDGYGDARGVNGLDVPDYMHYHSAVRARHETLNSKLKRFNVLTRTFRHERPLHVLCFHAVANITQTVISLEEPLFQLPW